MPTMSGRSFPKKRARCITARPSIARSTAKPRPKTPRNCTKKALRFIRSPCCRMSGIDVTSTTLSSWQFWAVLSAVFAALTAIFAKVGIENVNSDLATFIRTIVVICILALIVFATRQFQNPAEISGRTYLFLLLSGLGTGASWLCYFRALKLGNAAQVAPIDKLSVVLVAVFGVLFLGERLSALNWFGIVLVGAGAILVAVR